MPKLKTHKGMKKRFKVSATGKVSHKRCGSSHLIATRTASRFAGCARSTTLKVSAEAHRIRTALRDKPGMNPRDVEALTSWQRSLRRR